MLKLTQLSGFGGSQPPTVFDLTVSADASDIDLHDYLTARGFGDESRVTVTIGSEAQIYSTTTASAGLLIDLSDFPRNCRIDLTVDGEICGRGGASGAAGGTALEVRAGNGATLTVDNRGEINGGGGGGAKGTSNYCRKRNYSEKDYPCTGHIVSCSGGAGGTGYGPDAATGGTSGQSKSCHGCGSCKGGKGSAGGAKGQSGGGSGGAAGAAVVGNANIQWTDTGVRNGSVQ